MEYPGIEVDSVTSGIKRRVKDRIAKTKLNVSLASKIKTKILNNSSIFKISLKHNNRALARALSKEKENSRKITTEKMQLQKEVEKLNFENTFLRIKLNNLNKKLIEIESHVSSNLLTAIEMSSLSEFHQSSFLLSTNKKKRTSKQCKPAPLPYARVLLTSENDDDGDDGTDDKWNTKCNNRTISKTSPDSTSSISRQPLSLHQCNLEAFLPKEDNQKTCDSGHSEHTSSVDVLLNESHCHSDQSPKSSLLSEIKTPPSSSLKREKLLLGNVTKRKKCVSSTADILYVTDYLHKQITGIYPAQNESQISKIPRKKVNRKTEVISGVNCFNNDKGVHCSEKDTSFLLQKDKDIPGTLKDLSEFDTPAFCNKNSAKLCDYKSETLLGLKKHDPNVQPACQDDSKVGDDAQEKMKEGTHDPYHRTQKSRPGSRMSLVLVDTSCVSSNPANSENESKEQSSYPMRRRKCAPHNLAEPSLRSKMRR
ncbi:shugoshin 2 [Mastomys coucha]|uniref:shugoshin 2 n=1 Tax=Mastomys coucha TaxID=35658 RepID=UPI0012619D54|nr:shugoshin 2 [Mastomys coucha]